MKEYEVLIPAEVKALLEKMPSKPGWWTTPEIDAILIEYGDKKQFRDIASVIEKVYKKKIPIKRLYYRYKRLKEGV